MIPGEIHDEHALFEAAADAGTGGGDTVQHFVCCDDNVALCGQDVTEAGWAPAGDGGTLCPLCMTAIDAGLACPDPRCGGLPVTLWLGMSH